MMAVTQIVNLDEQIEYLKLPFIKESYREIAAISGKKQDDYIAFLQRLIKGETQLKKEKSIVNRIRAAKLPYRKTLADYNWNHPDKINRMQVENMFRLRFIDQKENIIFLGGCGIGKTHLAAALAEQACINGYTTLFCSAIDIINTLSAATAINCLDKAIKKYLNPKLLVIDELGYLPIDKQGANLLFQIISKRYETGAIVLTSNREFKNWAKIFDNDSTITSAVLDRLLHHSDVVVIEGKSYRMKDKIKESA